MKKNGVMACLQLVLLMCMHPEQQFAENPIIPFAIHLNCVLAILLFAPITHSHPMTSRVDIQKECATRSSIAMDLDLVL
jgi:hypothetical protein